MAVLGQLALAGFQLRGQPGDPRGAVAGLGLGSGKPILQGGLAILGDGQGLAKGGDLLAKLLQAAFLTGNHLFLSGNDLILFGDGIVLIGDLVTQH